MYEFENGTPNKPADGGAPADQRRDGGYSYGGGYGRETIYSDAHYSPAGQGAAPPKYYTPPPRQEKPRKTQRSGSGGRLIKLICLCLVCALLGGLIGAGAMGLGLSKRVSALESSGESSLADQALAGIESASSDLQSDAAAADSGAVLAPADIYDLSCRQVVGISSEITYINYFGIRSSSAVSGTGFIISEDGYILTNYHVIELAVSKNSEISVILNDGTRYIASVVGHEKFNDIAVLKIDVQGLTPVKFGDSDRIYVGDEVYAVGNPLGELDFSMSTGHVSALDRLITTDDSGVPINMFQIDAAVNSGNSGGPVYNSRGEVIGIVTAKYADKGVEGLGFAIPINDASAIADELITKGYVSGKAYMGVSIDTRYNTLYSVYYGMPLGAYVITVEPGSCAEKAGIQVDDIILSLDGQTITGYDDLAAAIHNHKAGDTVTVTIYRAGENMDLRLTFDEAKG